ncbi:hypothetical protein [Vibrio mexicanus]|uniref:hypothetical protein n=1 Tax=Vibrio mexicanus TaxID=1004326 RepID=UPI00063C0FD4|nr:hypothetical protein [Vibrio mexicanus]
MRKIQFKKRARSLSAAIISAIVGFGFVLSSQIFFSHEQGFVAYALVVLNSSYQYFANRKNNDSKLTTDANDIYLHGIPAALKHRFPIIGFPHIRVTSLTKNGYYRVRVYRNYVSKEDWQLLLSMCSD